MEEEQETPEASDKFERKRSSIFGKQSLRTRKIPGKSSNSNTKLLSKLPTKPLSRLMNTPSQQSLIESTSKSFINHLSDPFLKPLPKQNSPLICRAEAIKDSRVNYGILESSSAIENKHRKANASAQNNIENSLQKRFAPDKHNVQRYSGNFPYETNAMGYLSKSNLKLFSLENNVSKADVQMKNRSILHSSRQITPNKLSQNLSASCSFYETNVKVPFSRNVSKELRYVKGLADKDCDKILLTLHDDGDKFVSLLRGNVDRDVTAYVLIVLGKAITPQLPKHVNAVIHKVTSSRDFFNSIAKYLASFQRNRPQSHHCDSLDSLINFLAKFQTCLPSSSSDSLTILLPLLSKTCEMYLKGKIKDANLKIFKILEDIDVRNNTFLKHFTPSEAKSISSKEKLQLEEPPESFRSIPILPCDEDFLCTSAFIRPNVVSGQYQDTEHYLDVQFRLLREDYVKSLRDGVAEYKELKAAGKSIKKCINVRVYENVQLASQQILKIGLVYIAVFQVQDFSNVNWESSKRFTFGSLLCISDDDFKTMLFAVVAERKIEQLNEGKLMVKFEDLSEEVININPHRKFVVLETTAFFEAYRHNLKALKELDDGNFPMKRYVVDVETNVHEPGYLREDTTYDMRPLLIPLNEKYVKRSRDGGFEYDYPSTIDNRVENISVLNDASWPTASELKLDPSQYDALKSAITKEFAIIQGPPGTGKTYIGLRIVQLLLHNKNIWKSDHRRSPILIVCFSNHALDQFLEGLTFFTESIVRIGGRGKNENIEQFKLDNLRKILEDDKRVPRHIFSSIGNKLDVLKGIRQEIENTNELITECQNRILNSTELRSCISQVHFQSLCKESDKVSHKCMHNWLGIYVSEIDEFVFRINQEWLLQNDLSVDARGKKIVNIKLAQRNDYHKLKNSEIYLSEISKHISCILNYTFSLNSTDARNIRNVWEINIQFRWRLYKYWIQCFVMKKKKQFLEVEDEMRYIHSTTNRYKSLKHQKSELKQSIENAMCFVLNEFELEDYMTNMQFKSLRRFSSRYPIMYDWLELKVKNQNKIEDRIALIKKMFFTFRLIRDGCYSTINADIQNDGGNFADLEYVETQRDFDSDDIVGASYDVSFDKSRNFDPDDFTDLWQGQGGQSAVKKLFRKKLCDTVSMSEYQFKNVADVWDLKIDDRWKLYKLWIQNFIEQKKQKKYLLLQNFREEYAEMCELQSLKDVHVASKADIIGMTTTGAAKYRHIIETLKPSIVVVEEAAELLECHVVTSLTQETEHVILIGDHLQLRPNPNIHMLSVKYDLNVSLFERMVKNGLEFVQLHIQHRMRPEISGLLVPHIYKTLENHESVTFFDNVQGVNKNVFFLSHNFSELQDGDNQSKMNDHEAKFLISLCEYLIKQNYDRSKITILTTYSGQLFELKRLSQGKLQDVRITIVDNYQGEENDIILLSFVRSNDEGKIGFLKTSNRVCVALSRARKGLYCIGNFNLLAENSKLWRRIISYLNDREFFGSSIQLNCQNHPETFNLVKSYEDFKSVPEGGCKIKCDYRMSCGHICPLMCHPYDREHEKIHCSKPCTKICENDHACQRKCFEDCACPVIMNKTLLCKHEVTVECCINIDSYVCEAPCEKFLECNHKCLNQCSVPCTEECLEEVAINSPFCGHEMKLQCFTKTLEYFLRENCFQPCESVLSCGHTCTGCCKTCKQGQSHIRCSQNCKKILPCGHDCKSLCYEKCALCLVPVVKRSSSCNHERELECYRKIENIPCDVMCEKILLCGHKAFAKCFLEVEAIKCTEPCGKLLPCGHTKCLNKCGESCVSRCKTIDTIISPFCGHSMKALCFRSNDGNYLTGRCSAPCNAELICGHVCKGTCSTCHQGRLHIPCNQICKRILICGHKCESVCSKACPPCRKPCDNLCSHGRCLKLCKEPCDPCTEPCEWVCPHKKCTKLCSDICDRDPCGEPCLKLLDCQHPCLGFCGEVCPTVCSTCTNEECFIKKDTNYVLLEDCGHSFEVKDISKWINSKVKKPSVVKAVLCPQCNTPIKRNYRFGNFIKSCLSDIERAKVIAVRDNPSLLKQKLKSLCFTNKFFSSYLKKCLWDIKNVILSKKLRTISELNTMFNFYNLMKVFIDVSGFACATNFDRDAPSNCNFKKLKSYIRTTCNWMEPVFRDDFLTASEQQLFELKFEVQRLKLADRLLRFLQHNFKGETKNLDVLFNCILTYSSFRDFKALNVVLDDLERDDKELYRFAKSLFSLSDLRVISLNGCSAGNLWKCSKNHVYRAFKIIDYEMYDGSCPICELKHKETYQYAV